MNYRHIYHAGNFADCMKHALLVWLVRALQRKPGALSLLDTHAGVGQYDLVAGPAARTGEWRAGIEKLLHDPAPILADYVTLVRTLGLYPGSPALIRALLRAQDRLVCCELHPEDADLLHHRFARDTQVAVHHRNAWEALHALLPPRERRGLILIDPPYEREGEFAAVIAGLHAGWTKFRTGIFAAWYPIKHRAPVRELHAALQTSGIRDMVAAELWLRAPLDPTRLNGCGLVVINPPFGFLNAAPEILRALCDHLGDPDASAGYDVIRLTDE
ncbi:MAG: 23S rRNA (adenine(2030)-N(6))-methyltransferase RlmJ [Acetobacteraceae bacterium]|nr:23S rRNA (adenine(2030)-N(6))-methyltransferase RlmJ [Acetobacteraceae bacterium]MSP30111.1 23S rRNA (adenine(2030)-N(6))-methyltransferase RlmJ [Acetobacteraceae bacterium]